MKKEVVMNEQRKSEIIAMIENKIDEMKAKYGDKPLLSEQAELDHLCYYLDAGVSDFGNLNKIKGIEKSTLSIELSSSAPERLFNIREGIKKAYSFLENLDIGRATAFTVNDVKKDNK